MDKTAPAIDAFPNLPRATGDEPALVVSSYGGRLCIRRAETWLRLEIWQEEELARVGGFSLDQQWGRETPVPFGRVVLGHRIRGNGA